MYSVREGLASRLVWVRASCGESEPLFGDVAHLKYSCKNVAGMRVIEHLHFASWAMTEEESP